MARNAKSKLGKDGEVDVIEKVVCPNCHGKLMLLPPGYPLYDVQCERCVFRAQIKTSSSRPSSNLFGATWEVMNKVLKAGFMVPPLIVNYVWMEKGRGNQLINFYPFIPKSYLRPGTKKYSGSVRFNYTKLPELPNFPLYRSKT